jgi:nonsense-mediated mRNA decay protein 3
LKQVIGLNRVKLVDAHICKPNTSSQKVNLLLTIQKEISAGPILQQSFVVEVFTELKNCSNCNLTKSESQIGNTLVQVRQNVEHKRTFLMLEQLIIKNGADVDCIQITKNNKGLDFFFNKKSLSLKFIEFLRKMVPMRLRATSKKLLSHDSHSNTYKYNYSFSVEIVPICKDDLVYLKKQSRFIMGSYSPLMICTRITNTMQLIEPLTLQILSIDSTQYWNTPCHRIMNSDQLQEVIVLNVEPQNKFKLKRFQFAEIEIAKSSDFGHNDKVFLLNTHLGSVLRTGDNALAYDITTVSLVDSDIEGEGSSLDKQTTDIVLVRKSYSKNRKKHKNNRIWKLRQLEISHCETNFNKEQKCDPLRDDEDVERFLEEIEEDAEIRSRISLYMDHNVAGAHANSKASPHLITDLEQDKASEVPLEDIVEIMNLKNEIC